MINQSELPLFQTTLPNKSVLGLRGEENNPFLNEDATTACFGILDPDVVVVPVVGRK
jgi:hypothetical protein